MEETTTNVEASNAPDQADQEGESKPDTDPNQKGYIGTASDERSNKDYSVDGVLRKAGSDQSEG